MANGLDAPDGPGGIADVARVRALLVAAAREGRAMTYSEILGALGLRFTRPKMRALCATLDRIDTDGLPGQGWWIGAAADAGYTGQWTGPDAEAFVRARQAEAFRYWRVR
ncbi:ribose-phosphate pyrophosphokinase [Sphingomonas sp. WKB10]|nr:ribose-phosphate pyrophosphokinase [Sphingomonas sp. WKB10]